MVKRKGHQVFELLEIEAYERGSGGYEGLRRGGVDSADVPERYPDLIVRPASDLQVATSVRFALDHGLEVAVRSAGHSGGLPWLEHGGMLVDLSLFDRISLNAAAGIAQAEPAATSGQLSAMLAAHELMFPADRCADAGLGGFLTHGGDGWNARVWGSATDHIVSLDMVTAGGQLVRIDRDSDPAGLVEVLRRRNGGIITRFRLVTRPLPAGLMTSRYLYPVGETEALRAWLGSLAPALPPIVEVGLARLAILDGVTDVVVVEANAFGESLAESHRALSLLEGFGTEPISSDAKKAVTVEGLLPSCLNVLHNRITIPISRTE